MEQIIELIINNGMFVVLLGYFIYKDYKFNDDMRAVLGEVRETLSSLKEVVNVLSSFHK